ncbi:MAG: PDZ domain-containing protein [Desulfobacterales bacterium]|nr:PDZ domain-containing protein [Desulfobacterales bacterium]
MISNIRKIAGRFSPTKQHFIVLNLLLVTAIIFLGVRIFYSILSTGFIHDRQTYTSTFKYTSFNDDKPLPLKNYETISKRNLFDTASDTGKKPLFLPDIDKLKQTTLKLKLRGTVADGDNGAYAVIEDQKKKEQLLCMIGDQIQRATVKIILRKKVVLTVNGKDEILGMDEKIIPSDSSIQRPAVDMEPTLHKSPESDLRHVSLNRSRINDAFQNVNDLMKQAIIRPHFRNGEADGIVVMGIKPNTFFSSLGLRSGDIIKNVDGKQIESVDDALQFYSAMKDADNLKLEVQRRGMSKMIEYDIK